MASYSSADIRNLAFVGGGDAGKTLLVDALLFKGGVTTRLGSTHDGTSVSDFTPEEKEKKHSLYLSITHSTIDKRELNLVDTPGYPDFVGEAIAGLHAVETAVICVNAHNGVVLNTRKMNEKAKELKRARIVVVTKLDAENTDWDKTLDAIQTQIGPECKPVFLPIGMGTALKGVVDCFDGADKAPANMKDDVEAARAALIESLVEADEAEMERYLNGETIAKDVLDRLMTTAMIRGSVVPILCCSVPKDFGVNELGRFFAHYAPSPVTGPFFTVHKDDQPVVLDPKQHGKFSALVFKSVTDPYVGRVAYFRVFTGEIGADHHVFNLKVGKPEKFGSLVRPQGKDLHPVTTAIAGDIVAIPKIETLCSSDTLCDPTDTVKFAKMVMPVPMVGLAVEPKSRNDEAKLGTGLRKLADEDPTFIMDREQSTGELVIHGLSTLHLESIITRLKSRFHVEVTTKPPKIAYRETITKTASAQYRHKKQTGGAGQFAEIHLRVEPQERGKGFEFENDVFGGAVSGPYVASAEKGVRAVLAHGVVAGYPVVDVKAVVFDGKEHPVDSKDIAFQVAGRNAFKAAFKEAKPVLLEPIMKMEITVPSQFFGDISGDLNSRRGRIQGMDTVGNEQVIRAVVPLADVQNYSQDLRSMTSGEGSYTMEFSHYDVVPAKMAEQLMAKHTDKPDEDDH